MEDYLLKYGVDLENLTFVEIRNIQSGKIVSISFFDIYIPKITHLKGLGSRLVLLVF